jgi:hypothetical protein
VVGSAGVGGTRSNLDLISANANSSLSAVCAVGNAAAAGCPLVDPDIVTGVLFAK